MPQLTVTLRLTLCAALATALPTASSGCAGRAPIEAPVMTRGGVRFSLSQPDARTVALAGGFNGWSTASHLLSRQPSGVWTIVVELLPGEHAFMFVVDGRWVSPPVAEDYADDGFGKRN